MINAVLVVQCVHQITFMSKCFFCFAVDFFCVAGDLGADAVRFQEEIKISVENLFYNRDIFPVHHFCQPEDGIQGFFRLKKVVNDLIDGFPSSPPVRLDIGC